MPSSLQYGVGTDYFSYLLIFETELNLLSYVNRGEVIFPNIVWAVKYFNLDAQYMFFIVSFLNGVLFVTLLSMLKKRNYSIWLFFLVFICCTGVYNNQLNGLRQYMAVYAVPIIIILVSESRYIKFSFITLYSFACHASSLMTMPFYLLSNAMLKRGGRYFEVFFVTALLYGFLLPKVVFFLVENIFPMYQYYLFEERLKDFSLLNVITRLYYVPIFLVFYYCLYKRRIKFENKSSKLFVMVFSMTFWMFLSAQNMAIIGRVAQYFSILYAFPVYYLLVYFKQRNFYYFIALLSYIVFPYLSKVTFLAKNEYMYNWIVSN